MSKRKNANWRSFVDDDDRFDRVGRMKPRERKSSRSSDKNGDFELAEEFWEEKHPGGFSGRIVEVHKRYAFVSPEPVEGAIKTREVWLATVARTFLQNKKEQRNFIVVGDRVFCTPTTEDHAGVVSDLSQCVIQQLSPRRSLIKRVDPSNEILEHILASNVDQLLVVASFVSPRVKWGLVDRYLVLAELQGIRPIIVLNKKDLLKVQPEDVRAEIERNIEVYKKLGYLVFSVQANANLAKKNIDVQELKMTLKGKITMLSGHSGVGKSSLVNLFEPELVQAVEKNENIFYKGRHTTSYASFIKLGTGGYVIDTPGIRSFVLQELGHRDLSFGFTEFREYMGKCKYRECRHIEEPECAVLNAVDQGIVDSRRYGSYKGILLGTTGREGRVRDVDTDVLE